MTAFETLDADVFADTDPGNVFAAARRAWTIPAGVPVPSATDSGLIEANAGGTRPRVDPGKHPLGSGVHAAGANPVRRGDTLSDFIGTIYSAALDSGSWPQILAAAADYVGGQAAGLLSKDAAGAVCTVHHQSGFESGYVSLYRDEYWKMDPFVVSPFFPIGQPTTFEDFVPLDELREGRFYREWLQPQGWLDAVSVVLERSPTSCSTFVVARHETRGLVDDEMSTQLRLVAPHIRRAVQIGKLVAGGQAERATFVDVFDGLSAGVFLVDAAALIIHANVAGRAMLAARDFLHSAHSRLAARDPAVDRTLRAALVAAGKDDRAAGGGFVSVPLVSRDGAHYVAHLLPLTSGTGPHASIANNAVAALFVHKAALDHPSLPENVARYYKLTPTELRVLLGIVEVGGAPEVADALGIADNTVKTHLGRLYQKTGTRRQVDLVKLVAGFATPLLG